MMDEQQVSWHHEYTRQLADIDRRLMDGIRAFLRNANNHSFPTHYSEEYDHADSVVIGTAAGTKIRICPWNNHTCRVSIGIQANYVPHDEIIPFLKGVSFVFRTLNID